MDGIPHDEQAEGYSSEKGLDYILPKRRLQFGEGVSALQPFVQEFAFFTIAPAYLWGAFQDLVLWDYQNLRGRSVEFFHQKFHRPLFRGLELANGDVDWNHALWVVRRADWESFADHICATVLTDTPEQAVYRFGLQELEIADPLFVDRNVLCYTDIPLLAVSAVGVRSNRYTAGFVTGQHPPMDLPQLRFFPPDVQCKLYAQALFQADPQVAMSLLDDQTFKENLSASTSQLPARDGGQPGLRG